VRRLKNMKRFFNIVAIAILLILAGALAISCQSGAQETATLKGTVTIGPLTPVERPGVTPTAPPEVFAARKVMVYDASGQKLVREVAITQIGQTATGSYTVELAPGTYNVDINRLGIDRAAGLPREVTLAAGQTVTIDIDIDTGIR
jgi:hypothetical protein